MARCTKCGTEKNSCEFRANKAKLNGQAEPLRTQLADRWLFYDGQWWMCHATADTWDHIIPLSKGGTGWPSNLRPACRSCNSSKRDRLIYVG